MDLRFSEEQEMLRKMVIDFARSEVVPFIPKLEQGEFPREILKKMGKLGLMGIPVPTEIWRRWDGPNLIPDRDS